MILGRCQLRGVEERVRSNSWVGTAPLACGCRYWPLSCSCRFSPHGPRSQNSPGRTPVIEPKRSTFLLSAMRCSPARTDSPSASSPGGSSDPDSLPSEQHSGHSVAFVPLPSGGTPRRDNRVVLISPHFGASSAPALHLLSGSPENWRGTASPLRRATELEVQ